MKIKTRRGRCPYRPATRIVSLILSFAMLLTLTAGLDFSAYATSKTQSDAVNWANAQIGKSLDQDGVYGAQCVDLIRYYYQFLGVSPVSGNGCDYAKNSLPGGWQRIKTYNGFIPQPGDIAVWTYASSSYGHVAIVTSADSSRMNVVEQNGSTHITRSHSYSYSYGTFYGVIRPNFASGSGGGTTKQPVNLGDNFYAYIVKMDSWKHIENNNGNVCIANNNDNYDPKQIWHFIRQSDNSYKIINTYDDKYLDADNCGTERGTNVKVYGDTGSVAQKWFVYSNGGAYNICASYSSNLVLDSVSGGNDGGTNIQLYDSNNSSAQIFSIYDIIADGAGYNKPERPAKVSLSTTVNDKQVTVKWNTSPLKGSFDKREYDIRIDDNNGKRVYEKFGITGTSYTVNLSSYGKYKVTVAAVNSKYYNYYTMSDTYNICLHSYNSKVTKSATCSSTGIKTYTCTICGATKTETISKTAHSYDSGRITTQANCYQNGVKTYTCTTCGATKTETIPKISHSYSWKNSGGYIVNSCDNCGNEKVRLPFKDLSDIDYRQYSDYIEYTSVNNQFITGTNPPERTLFSPTAPITRAMFVTILYRMAGEPYKNANPYPSTPFTDITDTSVYYYDAACWALKNGITTETTFKPFDNVSREQTASFLFRYAKDNDELGDDAYKNVNLSSYPDYNSVHGWAVEAMQWANYNGMITGTQQGYINPQGATQRIHATKILYGFGKVCNIGNFS